MDLSRKGNILGTSHLGSASATAGSRGLHVDIKTVFHSLLLFATLLFISSPLGWSLLPAARWTPAALDLYLQLSGTIMQMGNLFPCTLQQKSTHWLWLDKPEAVTPTQLNHHGDQRYRKCSSVGLGQVLTLKSLSLNPRSLKSQTPTWFL